MRCRQDTVNMPERPDRMSQLVWGTLAVLGAVLAVVGWYHFVTRR
jgi:hypothetical protein